MPYLDGTPTIPEIVRRVERESREADRAFNKRYREKFGVSECFAFNACLKYGLSVESGEFITKVGNTVEEKCKKARKVIKDGLGL